MKNQNKWMNYFSEENLMEIEVGKTKKRWM